MSEVQLFDEEALYREICRVWGEHGAHAEVFRDMRKSASSATALYEALKAFMTVDKSFNTTCDRHLNEMAKESKLAAVVKQARAALSQAEGA